VDANFFADLQEALLLVLTPVLRQFLIFLTAAGGISAIGVVMLGTSARLTAR
jgi:hypothetical protein